MSCSRVKIEGYPILVDNLVTNIGIICKPKESLGNSMDTA